ncbi:MAG: sulfite exporter TauE/SafE family protein [Ignavibacteriaceae bacterium]|nr:sulfite exporter TauE/SafE family protein [Ignavibacteriaceae bacterium]
MLFQYAGIFLIGIIVGFLGGLFGKGGSAIATPMLSLIGIPGFIAVAAPLPATIPGTLIASAEYWKSNLLDKKIVLWSILIGVPATIIGSLLTEYTGALPLLIITGFLVLGFGLSFLLFPKEKSDNIKEDKSLNSNHRFYWYARLILIALFIGLISGLLANSGGFLLAPSYARTLNLPIKKAFACSLAVSAFLALPGTIVHAYLDHIDWIVTIVLALGSVPFSMLGAKVAIRSKSSFLERVYGLILTFLGIFFLIKLIIN